MKNSSRMRQPAPQLPRGLRRRRGAVAVKHPSCQDPPAGRPWRCPPGVGCVRADKRPAMPSWRRVTGRSRGWGVSPPRIWLYATARGADRAGETVRALAAEGVAVCGDEPAGCAMNDLVSSLAASGLSTCSVQVAPLLLYDRDVRGDGPYAAWTPCASGSGPRGARPPVHVCRRCLDRWLSPVVAFTMVTKRSHREKHPRESASGGGGMAGSQKVIITCALTGSGHT